MGPRSGFLAKCFFVGGLGKTTNKKELGRIVISGPSQVKTKQSSEARKQSSEARKLTKPSSEARKLTLGEQQKQKGARPHCDRPLARS